MLETTLSPCDGCKRMVQVDVLENGNYGPCPVCGTVPLPDVPPVPKSTVRLIVPHIDPIPVHKTQISEPPQTVFIRSRTGKRDNGARFSFLARIKWFLAGIGFHNITECCEDCGHKIDIAWIAEDSLWKKVNGTENGCLCPRCFRKRAQRLGIRLSLFEVREL